MGKKLTTQAAYAKQRGVSPQYISKLVKTGVLTLQAGKLDPEQSDKDIQAYASGLKGTPGPKATNESDDDSLASWRKRELQAKTALRQLQLDEEKGLLVRVDELRVEFARLFTDIKTTLRAIPSKAAGELVHMAKAAKTDREGMTAVSTLLLKEIDASLTELSRWKGTKQKSNKGGKKR